MPTIKQLVIFSCNHTCMDIKERIDNIKDYFNEMKVMAGDDGSQFIYVSVKFPRNWIINDELEAKFNVTVMNGNDGNHYFCTDITNGIDCVFDAVEYNVEKMQEAIERAQLLSKKTMELRDIFENESIDISDLRGLTFSYGRNGRQPGDGGDIILPKKRGGKDRKEQQSTEKPQEETEVLNE